MERGSQKPVKSIEEVGAADKVSGQGGFGCPDLGQDILGSILVSNLVWVGDVGDDPPNWEGVGHILPQDGPLADGLATLTRE